HAPGRVEDEQDVRRRRAARVGDEKLGIVGERQRRAAEPHAEQTAEQRKAAILRSAHRIPPKIDPASTAARPVFILVRASTTPAAQTPRSSSTTRVTRVVSRS